MSAGGAEPVHVDCVNFAALLAAAEGGDVAAMRRLAAMGPDLLNPRLAEPRDSALRRAVLSCKSVRVTSMVSRLCTSRPGSAIPRCSAEFGLSPDHEPHHTRPEYRTQAPQDVVPHPPPQPSFLDRDLQRCR